MLRCAMAALVALAFASSVLADQAQPLGALANLPVKEVTIFKDGHAFVVHSGKMPTDAAGNVVLDYLPTPILGTFWPYSAEKDVKLSAVTAGQRRVKIDRTALTTRDLIEANIGAAVTITDGSGVTYSGTIVGIPTRSGDELAATSPPGAPPQLPQKSNLVMIKLDGGTKIVNMDAIRDIAFKDVPRPATAQEEMRNLLTMKLEWPKNPGKDADVGMMYVQRGIRWIPAYKLTIDGKGNIAIKLEATVINELADLNDVTANLVVGVPTFDFKDMPDPMSMQQQIAQLSQYFREDSQTRYALSNAMMSQSARMSEYRGGSGRSDAQPGTVDLGPEVGGSTKNEDLFVFTVNHLTLRKGERMVMPISEFTVPYADIYKLDVPVAPPAEVWRGFDNNRQAELARLFAAPKVMHSLRITNNSKAPFTTAPALILRGGSVLAQGMMTYTAIGGQVDLPLTAAVNITVTKTDKETSRTPNAEKWQGDSYARIDLSGTIRLVNRDDKAVTIEVTRYVLGNADEAAAAGKAEMMSPVDASEAIAPTGLPGYYPYWWSWYSWPHWWSHFNGMGRFKWTVTLEPGKDAELSYTWHYLWR